MRSPYLENIVSGRRVWWCRLLTGVGVAVCLHNKLVGAILANANNPTEPSSSAKNKKRKPAASVHSSKKSAKRGLLDTPHKRNILTGDPYLDSLAGNEAQRQVLSLHLGVPGNSSRAKIQVSHRQVLQSPRARRNTFGNALNQQGLLRKSRFRTRARLGTDSWGIVASVSRDISTLDNEVDLCAQSKCLPDVSTLKMRMTKIASEAGLHGSVSDSAVKIMLRGLEASLRTCALALRNTDRFDLHG